MNGHNGISSEAQATRTVIPPHQHRKARLIDGNNTLVKTLYLVRVNVDAHDIVTYFRKHGPLNQPYVTDTKNGNFHETTFYILLARLGFIEKPLWAQ